MTWQCPTCGRAFRNRNQWHSCQTRELDDHLRGKSPAVQETIEKLIAAVQRFGETRVHVVKTSIQVRARATVVSIRPKSDHVDIEFQLGEEVTGFPVFETFRISKKRVLHRAVLEGPEDVDARLVDLLKRSYELVSS